MENLLVAAINMIIGVTFVVFGIFIYREENTNSLHANCGIFWKITMPRVCIVWGIGMMVIAIIVVI